MPMEYSPAFFNDGRTSVSDRIVIAEKGVYEHIYDDTAVWDGDNAKLQAGLMEGDKLALVCRDNLLGRFLAKHALYATDIHNQDTTYLRVRYPTPDKFIELIEDTKHQIPDFSPPGFRVHKGGIYSAEAFATAVVDGYVLTSDSSEDEHDMVSHNSWWLFTQPRVFQALQRSAEQKLANPGEPSKYGHNEVNRFMDRVDFTFELSSFASILLNPDITIDKDAVKVACIQDILGLSADEAIDVIRDMSRYARHLAELAVK